MSSYFFPLIAIGMLVGLTVYGIYSWYELDSAIDFDILNNQFATNQTFIDSLDCEKIILSINTLNMLISPTQQDEVKQLQKNFEDVKVQKGCA